MSDDSDLIGQSEIEDLLNQAKGAAESASGPPAAADPGSRDELGSPARNVVAGASPAAAGTATVQAGQARAAPAMTGSQVGDDVHFLLEQAEQAIASDGHPVPPPPGLNSFQFQEFAGEPASTEKATLDLLSDVQLDLKIELGRTQMELEEVLKLRRGSVVTLDKLAGDPVDVYVNGRLVARGEVLVLSDNFCVRVAELVSGNE